MQTFIPSDSPTSESFQRPREDMSIASGCPRFVPLTHLEEGSCFVKDDVMFVKCIVDISNIRHP